MNHFISFLLLLGILSTSTSCTDGYNLQSPNRNCRSEIISCNNGISTNVIYKGDTIVRKINLVLNDKHNKLLKGVQLKKLESKAFSNEWETINGKNKTVINKYNFYKYDLINNTGDEFKLEIRMYNAGFAYRFIIPEMSGIIEENSTIQFANDYTFWAYNGEHHNVGPVALSEYGNIVVRNPVTFKTISGKYFTIHEAAILEHAPFILTNSQNNTFNLYQNLSSEKATHSSWRAVILGETPGDLIESDLLVNLNEPCKINNPSWIKPGRAMWDWRVWGYTAPDGFQYGLNTISHKRFIDFAAQNNIQYLLIDADWYGPEFEDSSDPTSAREGVNIEECMAYAKEKGVGVILYLNDVGAKKFGLEKILKQFSEWGASGVKYGFMEGSPKEKVLNTRKIIELCASYKLMVNFHDNPIPPSGDRRTWPNLITKEFGHSQADAKRSYFPETIVTAPFVNMIAGPLDLCNGWFALNTAFTSNRPKVFEEIPGTVAAELAKLIVVYGGCFVLPDAPEEYLKKDDLFDCVRNMPAHFDSYKVLNGEIGQFISVARRSGDEWFIGSLTSRESRELTIDFSFLDKGIEYIATFYEDSRNSHYLNNKEEYEIKRDITINRNSKVTVKLAAGGGHTMWLQPEK